MFTLYLHSPDLRGFQRLRRSQSQFKKLIYKLKYIFILKSRIINFKDNIVLGTAVSNYNLSLFRTNSCQFDSFSPINGTHRSIFHSTITNISIFSTARHILLSTIGKL